MVRRRPGVRRRRGERGYALMVALFVAVVAMTAAAIILLAYAQDVRLERLREADVQLASLCDAGVARALAELARDPSWNGSADEELDHGTYSVEITRPDDPQKREVHARAHFGPTRRAVLALVDLSSGRPRVIAWQPEGGDLSGANWRGDGPVLSPNEGRELP